MSKGARVVVTGMGLRSPIGHTLESLRSGLLEGSSGVRAYRRLHDVGPAVSAG